MFEFLDNLELSGKAINPNLWAKASGMLHVRNFGPRLQVSERGARISLPYPNPTRLPVVLIGFRV